MKTMININGNILEVECTPAEFLEIFTPVLSKRRIPPRQTPQPDQPTATPAPKRRRRTQAEISESYAQLYHEALGMSFLDYISLDPNKPTDEFVSDILRRCTIIRTTNLPSEDRIRATVEAAKVKLTTPKV